MGHDYHSGVLRTYRIKNGLERIRDLQYYPKFFEKPRSNEIGKLKEEVRKKRRKRERERQECAVQECRIRKEDGPRDSTFRPSP